MHPFINEIKKRIRENFLSFVKPSLAIFFICANVMANFVCNICIGVNQNLFKKIEKNVHFYTQKIEKKQKAWYSECSVAKANQSGKGRKLWQTTQQNP